MEIAGRAGGLIPTNKIALRDLVLRGSLALDVARRLRVWNAIRRSSASCGTCPPSTPATSSSSPRTPGVNGSIVGFALLAKENGHSVIAVTSLEHTMAVQPKHPSGQRLAMSPTS